MNKKIIGIDLGGTSIKMAITSHQGELLQKWTIPTNVLDNGTHIVPDIIESIKHHLDLYQLTPSDFEGIGMGSPGQVDFEKGTVVGAYNLGWTQEQLLKEQFEAAFGLPFVVDNDANVAALGEQWVGAGEDAKDVVFITLGTGVGGGIIANGQLLHGAKGSAGEIGHMQVSDKRLACSCGMNGCLETVASATGIVNLARVLSETYAGDSLLKQLIDDGIATAKDVFDIAKQGDYFANQVVDECVHYLGKACSHIGNLLNPDYIIIGGGVSAAGDFLLDKVQSVFMENVLPSVQQSTTIKLATLGNDAGVLGAAGLIANR